MKRFGMVYFKNFKYEDFVWGLLLNDRDTEIIDTEVPAESLEEQDELFMERALEEKGIDVAVSFDFCPVLSDACMKRGIIYISWMFDTPIQMLCEKQVFNDCNYIFCFDKKQISELRSRGVDRVYYMPLFSNVKRNAGLAPTKADEERFSCDVSFIGSLYQNDSYNQAIGIVSEKARKELEQVTNDVFGKWDGVDRLNGRLSKEVLEELVGIYGNKTRMDSDTFLSAAVIARKIARDERIEMLKRLSKYNLNFFTGEKDVDIPGVVPKPHLSYIEELPKAYFFSKINMNVTLPSITSGVPLRVFDIMGVGGFALTNYQPEVDELFKVGVNIEAYHDFDEMDEKVAYYLSHERARTQIAMNGYELICKEYSVERQVERILKTVGQGI